MLLGYHFPFHSTFILVLFPVSLYGTFELILDLEIVQLKNETRGDVEELKNKISEFATSHATLSHIGKVNSAIEEVEQDLKERLVEATNTIGLNKILIQQLMEENADLRKEFHSLKTELVKEVEKANKQQSSPQSSAKSETIAVK